MNENQHNADPAQRVLDRLHNVTGKMPHARGEDRWQSLCPAHDDHEPSLSITRATDGGVLLKCYAGCKSEEVLDKLGLSYPDLYPQRLAPCKATRVIQNDSRQPWHKPGVWLRELHHSLLWKTLPNHWRHAARVISNSANCGPTDCDWRPNNGTQTYTMGVGEWLTSERTLACEVFGLPVKAKDRTKRRAVHAARKSIARFLNALAEWRWLDKEPLHHRHDGLRLKLNVPVEVASQLTRPNHNNDERRASVDDSEAEKSCRVPTLPSRVPTCVPTTTPTKDNSHAAENDVAETGAGCPASQPDVGNVMEERVVAKLGDTISKEAPVYAALVLDAFALGFQRAFPSVDKYTQARPECTDDFRDAANLLTARKINLARVVHAFFAQDGREEFTPAAFTEFVRACRVAGAEGGNAA